VLIDLINALLKLAAWLSLDLLNLLETTGLNECSLGIKVGGENFGELGANVSKNVVGGKLKKRLKGGHVSAHLDNVFEGLLGLILKVLGAAFKHVDSEQVSGYISLGKSLGVISGVATNLTERPSGSSLQVILRLVSKSLLERSNTLRHNNGHGKRIIKGRDVTEGHDTRETSITLGLGDVVNSSGGTTRVDNKLSELSGLLGNLSDAGSSILANLDIDILKAVQNSGEDLGLNDDFSKVNSVLSDLSKALANVSLELGIGVRDEGSEVRNGTLVNDSLGKLLSVLGNLTKSSGRDSLEGELGLLHTEHEETYSTGINDGLGQLMVVLSNAREG